MRPYIIFLGVVLTSTSLHPKALGGPITFFYEGVVTELAADIPPDSVFASLDIGEIFSGYVTFDSEPSASESEHSRLYLDPLIASVGTLGNVEYYGLINQFNGIIVVNDRFNDTQLISLSDEYSINFTALYDNVFQIPTRLRILDPTATMFTDLSLPLTPPDISHLDPIFRTFRVGTDANLLASGEITTLSLVPEPATLLLLSIGCLVVIRPRKMSTKHTDNQIETSRIL